MRRNILGSLLIALPTLALLSAWYWWNIHYQVMRANFYLQFIPMRRAEGWAILIPWLAQLASMGLILSAPLWPQVRRTLRGWFIFAVVATLLAFPVTLFSILGCDPHWYMRSESGLQMHHTGRVAAYLRDLVPPTDPRAYSIAANSAADLYKTVRFPNMQWPALPSGVVTHACAQHIVVAVDVIETRDFGVIGTLQDSFMESRRWIDYCHGRAVCFADGHAEIVPMEVFNAVWARSNLYREMLGLPREKVDNITYGRFKYPMATSSTTRRFVEASEEKPAPSTRPLSEMNAREGREHLRSLSLEERRKTVTEMKVKMRQRKEDRRQSEGPE